MFTPILTIMKEHINNPLVKSIADKMQGIINSKVIASIGTIISYDINTNTASVNINVDGQDKLYPIVTPILHSQYIKNYYKSGDNVVVLFINGDHFCPVILGKLDLNYGITSNNFKKTFFKMPI